LTGDSIFANLKIKNSYLYGNVLNQRISMINICPGFH